jgi:hypothetical protein
MMSNPSNSNPAPRKASASPNAAKGTPLNRPASPPSPYVDPGFMASAPAADPIDVVRGEGLALLGLPGSGKTSFLYYLKTRRADGAVGGRPWRMRTLGGEFDQQTGQQEEAQSATRADVFKEAALQMWRPILGLIPFGPRRKVVIPEIAGETVAAMARAGVPDSPAERRAYERLNAYLQCCDEVVFLASLDGHVGGKGEHAGSGARRAVIDAASVENALVSAVNVLGRIITLMHDSRPRGERIFISLLITKADVLKDAPGLDGVSLPERSSEVARLAAGRGRSWITRFLKSDGSTVSFSMNELCQSVEAFADIDVQEAAAFDFMRAHAPAAAEGLAKLAEQPDISIRFFMGGPYGREYTNARGQSVFPPVNALKQRTMVYEVLEDVVERSFRWRRRMRIRRRGAIAAVASLAFFLTGPALVYVSESNFRKGLESQDYGDAEFALRTMNWIPWSWVDRNLSDARRKQYAAERYQLLEQWTDAQPDKIDDDRVVDLADSVVSLDPDGIFGVRAREFQTGRNQRVVWSYIQEGAALPETVELNDGAALQLKRVIQDLRKGPAPWSSKEFQVSKPDADIKSLKERQERLRTVADMRTAARLQVPAALAPGFDEQLKLTRESVDVRIALLESSRQRGGSPVPVDLAKLREWALQAVRCEDEVALRYAESRLLARVDAEANQQPTSERAPGKPGSFKESVSQLARTDWPLKQQLDRERLAGLVREWVEAQLAVIVNLPVGEKDKPVDRIASQTKLGDALSGMLGERQALSDGDEAWAVEEPKGGVFAFWKSMTELQARADSIVKLGGSAGLPADLEKELRAAFVGTADGLLDRQVQYRPPAAPGTAPVDVPFQRLARAQQELAADLLDDRIATMDLTPSQDPSYKSTIDTARRCNELLRLVGAPLGDRYKPRVELRSAEFAIAEELTRTPSNGPALDTQFRTIAECAAGLQMSPWVLTSLAKSGAAPGIASSVLSAICAMKDTPDIRSKHAESFIRALDLLLFEAPQAKGLMAAASACELGIIPVVAEGLIPMQDQAMDVADKVLKNKEDLVAQRQLTDAALRIRTWLAASQWADAQGASHDSGVIMCRRTLTQAFEDMRHGKLVSPALRVLQEIGGGNSPSAELHTVAKAVADHVALAMKWNLKPVFFQEGSDPRVCKVLLAQEEWTVNDVATTIVGATGEAKTELARDEQNDGFPYRMDGTLKKPPVKLAGEVTDTGLQIVSGKHALHVVRAAGLRLPTKLEWAQALLPLLELVPSGGKNNAKKSRLELIFEQNGKSDAWIKDWSAANLRSFGDVTGKDEELVGLGYGVREWLADDTVPAGLSNQLPDAGLNQGVNARPTDTGIRPALDPYPEELRKACTPRN